MLNTNTLFEPAHDIMNSRGPRSNRTLLQEWRPGSATAMLSKCEYCRVTALYSRTLFQQWWPGPSTAVRSECKFICGYSFPTQSSTCTVVLVTEGRTSRLITSLYVCILPSNASDLESRIFEAGVVAKQGRGPWRKSALFTIAITAVHEMPPDIATRQE